MNSPYHSRRTDPLDLAAIAEFNAGTAFSRLAYELEHRSSTEGINYAKRIAASEASQRLRARKKEKQS